MDLQTLATTSGWESRALYDAFINGLSERIKEELLMRELPDDITSLIDLAIHVDTRLEERRRFTADHSILLHLHPHLHDPCLLLPGPGRRKSPCKSTGPN